MKNSFSSRNYYKLYLKKKYGIIGYGKRIKRTMRMIAMINHYSRFASK